jgi:hypothetical protein
MADWCAAIMKDEWVRVAGKEPDSGGFRPGNLMLTRLRAGVPDDRLEQFLRDAIKAWIVRCTIEGVTSPFFVDTSLLSERHIQWMADHRHELTDAAMRRRQGLDYSAVVYQSVLQGETEYLNSCLSDKTAPVFIPAPELWWAVACELGQRWVERLPKSELPIRYDGKLWPFTEALNHELHQLRKDRDRLRVFAGESAKAIRDAGMSWVERLGLGVAYHDIHQKQCIRLYEVATVGGLENHSWVTNMERGETLAVRDQRFVSVVRAIRGLEPLASVPPRFFQVSAQAQYRTANLTAGARALLSVADEADDHDED